MLKVLSYILCDLDPKVKVIGQKAGICDGVPSTSALVVFMLILTYSGTFSAPDCTIFIKRFRGSIHQNLSSTSVNPHCYKAGLQGYLRA